MPPPNRLTIDHCSIRANMLADEKGHPHMTRLYRSSELLWRFNNLATQTHAAHIVNWLAKNRELPRHNVMRRVVKPLCVTYEKLIINPAMPRELLISQFVIGWNDHMLGASNCHEVLSTPWICFYNRHGYTTERDRTSILTREKRRTDYNRGDDVHVSQFPFFSTPQVYCSTADFVRP